MASQGTDNHTNKPWRARVKEDGQEFFLGYFETQREAHDVENEFRRSIGKRERAWLQCDWQYERYDGEVARCTLNTRHTPLAAYPHHAPDIDIFPPHKTIGYPKKDA